MTSVKHIAVVSSSYFPFSGGQEVGLDGLILGMQQYLDCRVTIVTPRYERHSAGEETRNGTRVVRYPTTLVWYPRSLMGDGFNLWVHYLHARVAVPRILCKLNPDRVLAYFLSPTAAPAISFARARGIGCAVYLGGSDIYRTTGPVGQASRYALHNADRVIAASCFARDCARMNFSIVDKAVDLVPYGIDLTLFSEVKKESCVPPRILCTQRLVRSKGTHLLILALGQLAQAGLRSLRLDIVGDGPERPALERLVAQLGLNEHVVFHGEQDHERMVSFFQRSEVFCFPTLAEGFGIVLLEAMATGNIVIASGCTAIPEIVEHGRNGLIFQAGDMHSLARTLEPVLREPQNYRHLARGAVEVAKSFGLPQVGRRLAESLLATRGLAQ